MTSDAEGTHTSDLYDWLVLERIPRVGPVTISRLVSAFGSPRAALEAAPGEIRRKACLSEKLAANITGFRPPSDEIRRDMDTLEKLGARVITRWDAEYPAILKEIYDPPALLFVRGAFTAEDSRAVGIVGTRNPTRYGVQMTEEITRGLVRAGLTLVSGLARGIDTTCHRAAIKEGGRTLGVLGCGIDVPYPRENAALVEEMVLHGAVITEFRPGIPPLATNFYRRNRIISGLCRGVVVVEATRNSGSLITAKHALDQNRDVLAVPGSVLNSRSRGAHDLIKQGAALVESAEDIIAALYAQPQVQAQASLFEAAGSSGKDLSEAESAVMDGLELDPVPIDLLCESLGMEPGTLSGILLELELKGLVRQYPGKMFSRLSDR